ncbi:MAG: DUF2142 domain-containing protein [Armatimonadetes bacterium]|nr:DUF2142 domain-containing protein [Armatimonadota bacterium]
MPKRDIITPMKISPRSVLVLILGLFAALSLSYSFATRLKYGPDEPAHYIYIRSLAVNYVPPPISHTETPTENSESTHEGHQPPLYYALMAIFFALLKSIGASGDIIWRVLRLLDIPIGLLWVCSVHALAREYFGDEPRALASTAFVAFIPTSSYMAGVINNEMLISLLFTASMLPILRYFRTGSITTQSAAFLGVLMGLSALTKAQGLVLPAIFGIAAIAVCRRNNYSNWQDTLRTLAIVMGTGILVSGWWFARCWVVHGTPLPHSLNVPMLKSGMIEVAASPGPFITLVLISTLAAYGYFWTPFWIIWPFVPGLIWLLAALLPLTAAVLVGLAIRIRRNGTVDVKSLTFLLVAPALLYLAWLRHTLFVDAMANLQGRLFLSVATVVAIVWILGFDGLLKSDRAKRVGIVVGLAVMIASNALVVSCAVRLYT